MRSKTVSSAAESLDSNLQFVIAADRSCIAIASLGDSLVMILYEKNFVMATNAKEVMGAEVDEDRMTCRKGCNSEGVSKLPMSVHPLRSFLK